MCDPRVLLVSLAGLGQSEALSLCVHIVSTVLPVAIAGWKESQLYSGSTLAFMQHAAAWNSISAHARQGWACPDQAVGAEM